MEQNNLSKSSDDDGWKNGKTKGDDKMIKFIEYFNDTMSKPFKWTYQGKALKA